MNGGAGVSPPRSLLGGSGGGKLGSSGSGMIGGHLGSSRSATASPTSGLDASGGGGSDGGSSAGGFLLSSSSAHSSAVTTPRDGPVQGGGGGGGSSPLMSGPFGAGLFASFHSADGRSPLFADGGSSNGSSSGSSGGGSGGQQQQQQQQQHGSPLRGLESSFGSTGGGTASTTSSSGSRGGSGSGSGGNGADADLFRFQHMEYELSGLEEASSSYGSSGGKPRLTVNTSVASGTTSAATTPASTPFASSSGTGGGGSTGGSSSIFSSFLTWMQEKPPQVFVVATANRIEKLPAEVIRKGRFDQLFFLDLPSDEERRAIFRIHIKAYGADPETFNMNLLSIVTKDWSGAEIEQAVKAARIHAFQEGRVFDEKDITYTSARMVPLSRTMEEQIKHLRQWSQTRATPASKKAA